MYDIIAEPKMLGKQILAEIGIRSNEAADKAYTDIPGMITSRLLFYH